MAKFLRVPAAIWRKFLRRLNEKGEVTFKGFSIPIGVSDEPVETRSGYNVADKSPFYESDPTKLFAYYKAYRESLEAKYSLLYADVYAFRIEGLRPIPAPITIDVKSIDVHLDAVSWRVPSKVQPHAALAVDLFKAKGLIKKVRGSDKFENNTSIRIESIDQSGVIKCRPATYFDQVGTNITLDWASGKLPAPATTLRNGEEHPIEHRLQTLGSSILANTLGVAIVFYDAELNPDIRLRADDLASIQKRGLHCTASGVWELPTGRETGRFDGSFLEFGATKEIEDEVGLKRHEYALFPIAIARELPRGGKPQIFFAAISLVSSERYEEAKRSANESYEFVIDDSALQRLQDADAPPHEAFTYEGWAAVYFANQFVEANSVHLRSLVARGGITSGS